MIFKLNKHLNPKLLPSCNVSLQITKIMKQIVGLGVNSGKSNNKLSAL